jgi:WD40 repeat protein
MEVPDENETAQVDSGEIQRVIEIDRSLPPPEDDDEEMIQSSAAQMLEGEEAEKLFARAQRFVDEGGDVAEAVGPEDYEHVFLDHTESVFCVAINPVDPDMILSGSCDDKAILWDVKEKIARRTFADHKDTIVEVAFSSDGKYFATASLDATINVYVTKSGNHHKTLEGPGGDIHWMTWHKEGYFLAAGSADTTVWLWNAKKGAMLRCFAGHIGPVLCGGFTNDGKLLFSASDDASLYVWSPRTGEPVYHLKGNTFHMGAITSVACHPTQPLLLTGSYDATAQLINLNNGKPILKLEGHEDAIESVGFSNVLSLCHTASLDGSIKIWDLKAPQRPRCTLKHDDVVIRARWHPSEAFLFSCSKDKTLRCWDGRTGECLRIWRGHQGEIYDFRISQDGKSVYSAGDDSTVEREQSNAIVTFIFNMLGHALVLG